METQLNPELGYPMPYFRYTAHRGLMSAEEFDAKRPVYAASDWYTVAVAFTYHERVHQAVARVCKIADFCGGIQVRSARWKSAACDGSDGRTYDRGPSYAEQSAPWLPALEDLPGVGPDTDAREIAKHSLAMAILAEARRWNRRFIFGVDKMDGQLSDLIENYVSRGGWVWSHPANDTTMVDWERPLERYRPRNKDGAPVLLNCTNPSGHAMSMVEIDQVIQSNEFLNENSGNDCQTWQVLCDLPAEAAFKCPDCGHQQDSGNYGCDECGCDEMEPCDESRWSYVSVPEWPFNYKAYRVLPVADFYNG